MSALSQAARGRDRRGMQKGSTGKEDLRALYACLDKESGKVFYASLESLDRLTARLRSSTRVKRGATIHLAPIPENWTGDKYTPSHVMDSTELLSGYVARIDGGSFTLHLATEEAKHIRKQQRDGSAGADDLSIEVSQAGAVTTVEVSGCLGVSSGARLQSALKRLKPSQSLVLLDMTDMTVASETAAMLLLRFIFDFEKAGRTVKVLLRPISRFLEIAARTEWEQTVSIHTNRDMAVASLLKESLED